MSISKAILGEFNNEAPRTRRMLEVLPQDHFGWKPHEKSMTLSRLAGHIAEIPGWAQNMVGHDALDFGTGEFKPFDPSAVDELLTTFDAGVAAFQEALDGADDETLMRPWTLRNGDHVIFQAPCVVAMRGFVLNHVVHHRGQLSVFMRLQDVALPSVYGPTADDQSF